MASVQPRSSARISILFTSVTLKLHTGHDKEFPEGRNHRHCDKSAHIAEGNKRIRDVLADKSAERGQGAQRDGKHNEYGQERYKYRGQRVGNVLFKELIHIVHRSHRKNDWKIRDNEDPAHEHAENRRRADLGSGRVAYVDGKEIESCIVGFASGGIILDDSQIIALPGLKSHVTQGQEMVRYLITRDTDFDGVFAMNDGWAMGAYIGLTQSGLRVPEDVKLVGFDGISKACTEVLNITSIQQNVPLLARYAGEMLLQLIAREPAAEKRIIVPTNVLYGRTT